MNINKYTHDLYHDHLDLTNNEKLEVLGDISEELKDNCVKHGIDKREYIKRVFDGDLEISDNMYSNIELLIESHYQMILRICGNVVRKHNGATFVSSDLIYYAIYGIHKGSLNYDPNRVDGDISVLNLMWSWVETYVKRGANSLANQIHIPVIKFREGTRLSVYSMCTSEDDEGNQFGSVMGEADPAPVGSDKSLTSDLETIINTNLKPKERYIISSLYGINGFKEKSVSDLSEEFGITKQMIYTYRKTALNKMGGKV